MVLFKLTTEERNNLYLGRYLYNAKIKILGMKYMSIELKFNKNRKQWANIWRSYFRFKEQVVTNNGIAYAEAVVSSPSEFVIHKDAVDIIAMEKILTWLHDNKSDDYEYRIVNNNITIYSNNLELLRTLEPIHNSISYHQAMVILDKDTKYFKKQPKYKFRTYFSSKRMPESFSDNVNTLTENYKNSLHFSPALKRYANRHFHPYRYLHSGYFVEYNDKKFHTILSIYFSDMLGKTFKLEKQP